MTTVVMVLLSETTAVGGVNSFSDGMEFRICSIFGPVFPDLGKYPYPRFRGFDGNLGIRERFL